LISQEESGLTASEYGYLASAFRDPLVSVVLQQRSLTFSDRAEAGGVGTNDVEETFDACVVGDVLLRAWAVTGGMFIESLASEDSGNQSWSTGAETLSIDTSVQISFSTVETGTTTRLFFYDGSTIKYIETADSGASWGSAQTVSAQANVKFLASTGLNV
jgi:hypothetical protein